MSDKSTRKMIDAVRVDAEPTLFLSSMFQAPRRNFFNSESIEFDIIRGGREIAPVVTSLAVEGTLNSVDQYTNKEFTPPIHREIGHMNGFDMNKRQPGQDPFQDPNFMANAMGKSVELITKNSNKIKRTNELQAAQVLQTGTCTLKDEKNNDAFVVDYKPKTAHFPSVATAWSDLANATPLIDIENLADVIHTNGKVVADMAIFGKDAWINFIRNTKEVQPLLDNRRMELGGIIPREMGPGAKYMGWMECGSYRIELWCYIGEYDDLGGSKGVRYVDANKVIVKSSGARMDAMFGSIPRIVQPAQNILPFLPQNIRNSEMQMGMTLFGYSDVQGVNVFIEVGARPLMVPSMIDSFGCLDVS